MGIFWKHFKTVVKHKRVVYHECKACGLWWQGVIHDMSKFNPAEFIPSARYFQGNRNQIEAEKDDVGYSVAWFHHKGHNKHHWEWWTDFDMSGNVTTARIPAKYVVEMVCDWIGAGKVYGKGNWTQEEPLNYYNKVKAGRHFHPDTERLIVFFLKLIRDEGLDSFHKFCKNGRMAFELYEDGRM